MWLLLAFELWARRWLGSGVQAEELRVRVLVTGGAGFIGHHLVRRLVDDGDEVHVIDDLSTGFKWRLEPVLDRIKLVEGSILVAGRPRRGGGGLRRHPARGRDPVGRRGRCSSRA